MDLLTKVAVAVVIIILIAGAGFLIYNAISEHATSLTAQQASQIVVRDLLLQSPSANITIINVTPSALKRGSWSVTLSVVYNATRPCPTLFIEAFDYPATGLVPSIDNLYTQRCVVYGLPTAPSYVISSPSIAMVQSYDSGFPPIADYVSTYGYNSTTVHARFFATLPSSMTPLNRTFYNAWLVNYTAKGAPHSQYVILSTSGAIIGNYTA